MKYGRLPRDTDRPALTLENYLSAAGLPPAPLVVDRASKVPSWPMYMNGPDPDNQTLIPKNMGGIGDCTIAAAGHMIQGWTTYATTEITISALDVLLAYEHVSGFNPVTGANDNGAQMQDVLAYWKGTGIATHKIAGYAAFGDPTDLTLMRQVLNTFGTVYVGVNLPESAEEEFGNIWTYESSSPIVGGHAICLQQVVTGQIGVNHVVTWGRLQKATNAFMEHYTEEAWAVVSQDWIDANGTTIEGLDLTRLLSDMQYV